MNQEGIAMSLDFNKEIMELYNKENKENDSSPFDDILTQTNNQVHRDNSLNELEEAIRQMDDAQNTPDESEDLLNDLDDLSDVFEDDDEDDLIDMFSASGDEMFGDDDLVDDEDDDDDEDDWLSDASPIDAFLNTFDNQMKVSETARQVAEALKPGCTSKVAHNSDDDVGDIRYNVDVQYDGSTFIMRVDGEPLISLYNFTKADIKVTIDDSIKIPNGKVEGSEITLYINGRTNIKINC